MRICHTKIKTKYLWKTEFYINTAKHISAFIKEKKCIQNDIIWKECQKIWRLKLSDEIKDKKWLPCNFSLWCDEPKYDCEGPVDLHKP